MGRVSSLQLPPQHSSQELRGGSEAVPQAPQEGVGSTLGVAGCEQGTKMLKHKKVKNSKLKLAPQVIVKVNVGH